MSDLGLICDVCGRIVRGMTFVNGMKFCAKCYQETFNNNVTKDILNKEMYELQINNLKQQLAEKDKEIDRLIAQLIAQNNINKRLDYENQKLYEDLYCEPNNKSLVIEELEKVKDSILDSCNGYWRYYYKDGSAYMKEDDISCCCEEYIDQRIKELKGK